MKWILPLLTTCILSGCASTTIYQPMVVNGKEGTQSVKSAKILSIGGDLNGAFTLVTQPGGGVSLDVKPIDASQVVTQKIAVTDSKGNPLLDKEGRPIFNEIPLVAGLNHTFPTNARGDAFSKAVRSIGSLAGTIAASVTGASAANSLAGAIPTN